MEKTEKEIKELIEYLKEGNLSSRNILIEYYKPTAEKIASEYFGLGLENEDVISSAYEGLVLGINKFSISIGNTDLSNDLNQSIKRTIEINILAFYGISFDSCSIDSTDIINVLKAKRDLKASLHCNPNLLEISNYSKKTPEEIEKIMSIISKESYKPSEENEYIDFENSYLEKEKQQEFFSLIEMYLTKRELKAFYLRTYTKLTQEEIGRQLNITKQAISQMEERYKNKIKEIIELTKTKNYNEIKSYIKYKQSSTVVLLNLAQNNTEALNCLIVRYTPIIENISSEYSNLGLDNNTLTKLAIEGLKLGIMVLIEKGKNSHFIDRIEYYIRKLIETNLLSQYNSVIGINSCRTERRLEVLRLLKSELELKTVLNREPSTKELSHYMLKSEQSIEKVKKLIKRN